MKIKSRTNNTAGMTALLWVAIALAVAIVSWVWSMPAEGLT